MADRNEHGRSDKLLGFGIIGVIVAALCCFTPILVVLVSAVGLSAIIGLLDYILFPSLAVFVVITIFALWRRQVRNAQRQS